MSMEANRRHSSVSTSSSSQRSPTNSSCSPEQGAGSIVTQSDYDELPIDVDASPQGYIVQPKIEELDDDLPNVYDLDEAKPVVIELPVSPPAPRKRGRPRKYPKGSSVQPKKTSHARSKTGCGTCRRRKKKCDEEKPHCLNCKKNNVTCDGYEPMQPWQSGRQKALTVTRPPFRLPEGLPTALPLLINGIENGVDMMFFQHFTANLENVLSLTDTYNPFKEIIVPMAMHDEGLMHSVLYLSGSCLTASESRLEWEQRQIHHNDKAITILRQGLEQSSASNVQEVSSLPNGDPSIAQTLVLFLQTVCAGAIHGEYRVRRKYSIPKRTANLCCHSPISKA